MSEIAVTNSCIKYICVINIVYVENIWSKEILSANVGKSVSGILVLTLLEKPLELQK